MKRNITTVLAIFIAILCMTSCRQENISIIDKVSYGSDKETKLLQIIADCGWTVSKDDNADWIEINPMSGAKSDTAISVTVSEYLENNIRTASFNVVSSKGNATCKVTIEQNGEYIKVSENILPFFSEQETKNITVTSNCNWTINCLSNSDFTNDFYTLSTTSGSVGTTQLSVQVSNNYTAKNSTGLVQLKSTSNLTTTSVRVKQNGRNETNIINSVWGMKKYERWNTDYYGNILEETYVSNNYVPENFNSEGWTMYFLMNNHGEQSDRKYNDNGDLVQVFYPFDYEYDSVSQHLHITFENEDPELNEYYDTEVITLNDSILVFQDEYREHFFEKATMRKVGYVDNDVANAKTGRVIGTKRRGQPIFGL